MSGEQGIKQELSIGELVSKTFNLYRRDFTKYLVPFLVVEAVVGFLTTLVQRAIIVPAIPSNSTPQQLLNLLPGFFGAIAAIISLTAIVTWVFYPVAIGTAVKVASDEVEKGQADLGASVRFAVSKLVSLWLVGIVVGVIVALGFIALVVPGIILAIMFSLVLPVIIIESPGVLGSLGRSRELVGHRWLKTFAVFIVFGIIIGIASAIASLISSPFGVASNFVSSILSAFYVPLIPIVLTVYYFSNVARIAPPQVSQTPWATMPPMAPVSPIPPAAMVQAGTKYCLNCGTQLPSTATFCSKCGARQTA